MTTTLAIIGVCAVTVLLMRGIEWLDTPRKENRRRRV